MMVIHAATPHFARFPSRPVPAQTVPEPVDEGVFLASREVALLPALDPAVCATVVLASVVSGISGGAGLATMAPSLQATLGDKRANMRYRFHDEGMTTNGTVEDGGSSDSISEALRSVGNDRVRLFGRFGTMQESLLIDVADNQIRVTGQANDVDVDLTYSLGWQSGQGGGSSEEPEPGAPLTWCDVRGTIGGMTYKAQASLASSLSEDDTLGTIQVEGQLADQPITKNFSVTTDPDMTHVVMEGGGSVAGEAQRIRLQLALSPEG